MARKTARASTRTSRSRVRSSSRRRSRFWWARLSDEKLLDLRFKDLNLTIEGTELEYYIARLYSELERKGFIFRPHFWLSNEWFSPDGVPGIAIPFYLAHPRLRELEKVQMLEVEGGSEASCMRILRHETGHTIDTAYRLHRRKRWREIFGRYSMPYPESYKPKPFSKSYVVHLDMWYAQAHPAEDFAETFAVWLKPGSRWRQQYAGWGAMKKLEYVDELMREIVDKKPVVNSRAHVEPLRELSMTLREHYHKKRMHYLNEDWPEFYDADLRKLFSDDPKYRRNPTAASFLRKIKPDLRKMVSRWTGEYQYTIEQVLADIIDRCQELRLRLVRSPSRTYVDAVAMVTVQTMNYLHAGNHRVAL